MKDPRLRLSVVIMTLQVLGQTVLGFRLSIAQVLVAISTSLLLEAGITLYRGGDLKWPASAMLTGNGVALLLRTVGTRHGDWWSLNGAEYFAIAAVLGIASKHLVRPFGRHIYNPSNLGLVLTFILAGPAHVYPQYLWWGPMGVPVAAAWLVIIAGAIWVLRPIRMWPMVLAFAIPFALIVAGFAAGGACFDAIWRRDSVCGANYWIGIAASPEVAIFVLFMMSDPRTSPRAPVARAVYGLLTALVAAGLLYLQQTEFGIKVSILAALTIVCTLVPLIEMVSARRRAATTDVGQPRGAPGGWAEPRGAALPAAAVAAAVITLGVSGAVVAMGQNQELVRYERGTAVPGGDSPRQQGAAASALEI